MPVPTQPVTINLADFGGTAAADVTVTARLSQVDYTADGTFVSTEPVTGVTDVNGQVVLELFPNALSPDGLGTIGSVVRVTARIPYSLPLDVLAMVPDHPCNLVNIVVVEEPTGLSQIQIAVRAAIDSRLYPNTYAVAPLTRPDGTARQPGDRYLDTDFLEWRWSGAAWINLEASARASATAALVSAGVATAKALEAANYAAAAATGAVFKDTIALGLVAVADGQNFGVKAGGADGLLRPTVFRRDTAATYTLLYAVVPGSEYDSEHRDMLDARFSYGDSDGNLVIRVGSASTLDVMAPLTVDATGGMKTSSVSLLPSTTMKYSYALGDADGNLRQAVDLSGKIVGDVSRTTGMTALRTGGTYDYDINFFPIYGQSLSVGQARPAVSRTQKHDNLMFVDGMRPQYDHVADSDAVRYGSFVPAIEENSAADATLGETSCTASGEMVKQLIQAEDGLVYTAQGYQLLHSAPGFGATTIAQLSKGTAHYTRLMTQVAYGLANASALNKSFAVQAVGWMQGESDAATTQAAYYAALNTLIADINTDAKAITGQTKNIYLISYQLATEATPKIGLAQLQACNANPLIRIATPMYIFDYQAAGNVHLMTESQRLFGAYEGLAYKRIVIDGVDWKPLQPVSSTRSGNCAYVKFNVPVGKLVLDTSYVTQNTNYGFELFQADGVTPIAITGVSLRGSDTVKITAGAAIPAGAKLHYAWSGTATNYGRKKGPRGNLRDQQGESFTGHQAVIFDPAGMNQPMHNWCVIFDWSL